MSKLDLRTIREIGQQARAYARDTNVEGLEFVASILASSKSKSESASIRWWWHAGVRDFAVDMAHLRRLEADLEEAVTALI